MAEVDFSTWMNVHIYSSKSIKSFHVLQITHSDIRQPYFVQKVFSHLDPLREIMRKTIVMPCLSDKQDHLRFLEVKNKGLLKGIELNVPAAQHWRWDKSKPSLLHPDIREVYILPGTLVQSRNIGQVTTNSIQD